MLQIGEGATEFSRNHLYWMSLFHWKLLKLIDRSQLHNIPPLNIRLKSDRLYTTDQAKMHECVERTHQV